MKRFGKNEDQDDFQFKPLTEGLGFHKKTVNLKNEEPGLGTRSEGKLFRPQSRRDHGVVDPQFPTGNQKPSQPKENPTAQWKPSLPDAEMEQQVELRLEPKATAWAAGLLDGLMVSGITLLFLAVALAITQVQFDDLVLLISGENDAKLSLFVLFLSVLQVYSVGCRTFVGYTLGEMAFETRLGTKEQQLATFYPARVAWRTLLNCLTGFVLLPAISSYTKVDVAGILSGVELQEEKI